MEGLEQITLEVDSSASETVFVKRLGDGRLALADTPVLVAFQDVPLHAGDIIEVESAENGGFRIRGVARSDALHYDFAISREFFESNEYVRFCEEISAAGGTWESVLGGLMYVHLPPRTPFDVEASLSRWMALATNEAQA